MNIVNRRAGAAAALIAGVLGWGVASAATVTMGFDELATVGVGGQYVADYYNGGCGGSFNSGPVTCNGPGYGAVWAGASVAYGDLWGVNAPSGPNVLRRGNPGNLAGPVITLNVANGFTDGFSFYYSSTISATALTAPSVTLYSGVDGTGDILYTTGKLAPTPTFAQGCPNTGLFPCWTFIGNLVFDGVVHSVVFDGPVNGVAWDSVSFNIRPTNVPEPAVLGMFGVGALLIGGFAALRRRQLQG